MARERVLIAAQAGVDDEALVRFVRAVVEGRNWPTVMLIPAEFPGVVDPELVALLNATDAQIGVVELPSVTEAMPLAAVRSEPDSIVTFGVDAMTAELMQSIAASLGIPVWQASQDDDSDAHLEVGGVRFRRVAVPILDDNVRHTRTWSFWISTFAAGLLALVVGVAGTFSYLSLPPLGIIIAALAVGGVLVGARASVPYRTPSAVAAITLLLTVMLLSADPFGAGGAQGSVLVPSSILGWCWIGVVAVGTFATLALPDFRALRRTRMESREGAAS